MKQFLSVIRTVLSDAKLAFHHEAASTIFAIPAPHLFQSHLYIHGRCAPTPHLAQRRNPKMNKNPEKGKDFQ